MNQVTQMYRCVARIHILVWFLWGGVLPIGDPQETIKASPSYHGKLDNLGVLPILGKLHRMIRK